ncbi:MAG: transposase [Pseudomonadota bacterium]
MPRKPRFFIPGFPAHVVQRGNNRQAIFFEDVDFELYLSLLAQARDRYGCKIHSYVLMTNHTHLLVTPKEVLSMGKMMQYVGRHYVPYINRKYWRCLIAHFLRMN